MAETPAADGTSFEGLPTEEEIENLEEKIKANADKLANINSKIASITSAHCPPNSEIIHELNVSKKTIEACIAEGAQLAALINYVKEELNNCNN